MHVLNDSLRAFGDGFKIGFELLDVSSSWFSKVGKGNQTSFVVLELEMRGTSMGSKIPIREPKRIF